MAGIVFVNALILSRSIELLTSSSFSTDTPHMLLPQVTRSLYLTSEVTRRGL
ncbi:hypothetical protein CKA32_002818 [Geitlerinema sp. FC II]|nr:hypothetical protein CKA32_002818 [Geitlerinema sp. FC II]